jgi:hypothetical protein
MNDGTDNLPADLAPLGAMLDELGRRDRAAPAGMEERIFHATRSALVDELAVLRLQAAPPPSASALRLFTPMRLAAAVVAAAAGAAIWLASWPAGPELAAPLATVEQEVDYLWALAGLDNGWSSLPESIDLLKLETETVADSLGWEWPAPLLEGAM